ncbi:MAG: carbohydrate ABC transporter permease [Verrucomicrobia bacterium]|nr:carbohydrate ABC transporter permease [Verrucomicrobiota bacterium]
MSARQKPHWKWFSVIALCALGLTMVYPLLWMIGTSLKTSDPAAIRAEGDAASVFPSEKNILRTLFPKKPHWENFRLVFEKMPFARYYLNSVLVALIVMAGQVFTSSLAAYAFSRLNFRGRDAIFLCYLATMMIPTSVTLIPNFILMSRMGAIDSYFALIAPPLFSAYGTFMLRQFFMGIPKELEEAAVIDGCGVFRIYLQIVLPLSTPALATLAIFTFLGNWKSLLTPLVMINRDELRTLPLGMTRFMDMHTADWTLLMAAGLMSIIPMVAVFLVGQRHFVAGIRMGAVKG